MDTISRLMNARRRAEELNQPFTSEVVPSAPKSFDIIPVAGYPRSTCKYTDLKYIDSSKLIEPTENMYFYNACICRYKDGYRLFYRVSKEPKGFQDKIATCLMDSEFNIVENSNKYLDLYSNWHESARYRKLKEMVPYIFKKGEHIEDPRVVMADTGWFVFYTDGLNMAVAKLDLETCEPVYSHYMFLPKEAEKHHESDSREKNWVPVVVDGWKIFAIYSDSPRTIIEYRDTNKELAIKSVIPSTIYYTWDFGNIRGGTPPAQYSKNEYIWFFHSLIKINSHIRNNQSHYLIGAYVTELRYPWKVKKITKLPLLVGIAAPASRTHQLADYVVYPCGAVKTEKGWTLSMGIHDYEIALLDVQESDLFW